ncbi:MAG: DNA double-strand break repair helicase HerA [Methanonatronarchaeales archaeon]|nr:DNA double-strand break repair helicase HerA [Methanonatronarchaeales archaeon]
MSESVGVVSGGDAETFAFLTEERMREGAFVCYEDAVAPGPVLGRVSSVSEHEPVASEFLSPGFTPEEVMETAGFDSADVSKLEVEARTVGYFDAGMREFVNPRTPPLAGTPVTLADSSVLSDVSKRSPSEENSVVVGEIQGTDTSLTLDVTDVVGTHVSVIASTGSGKSYTVAVLLEEMLKARNGVAGLVLDPHGEYGSLEKLRDRELLEEKGVLDEYELDGELPEVQWLKEDDVSVRVSDLSFDELASVVDDGSMSEKMRHYLEEATRNVRRERGGDFTKAELLDEVRELSDEDGNLLIEDDTHRKSVEGLVWRYKKYVLSNDFFQDYRRLRIDELFRPRQLTVLDMSGMPNREQQLVASVLLRRTFKSRRGTERGRYTEGDGLHVPYPVFVALEEGHRFAPAKGSSRSKAVLKTILSEGRKFGVGVALVSQRPSKLDPDSLSQCMTQVTMRITNPADQQQVRQSVESVSQDIVDALPALSTGEAIVSGAALNTPVTAKVRERVTPHGGETETDPASQWRAALRDEEDLDVERDGDPDLSLGDW